MPAAFSAACSASLFAASFSAASLAASSTTGAASSTAGACTAASLCINSQPLHQWSVLLHPVQAWSASTECDGEIKRDRAESTPPLPHITTSLCTPQQPTHHHPVHIRTAPHSTAPYTRPQPFAQSPPPHAPLSACAITLLSDCHRWDEDAEWNIMDNYDSETKVTHTIYKVCVCN